MFDVVLQVFVSICVCIRFDLRTGSRLLPQLLTPSSLIGWSSLIFCVCVCICICVFLFLHFCLQQQQTITAASYPILINRMVLINILCFSLYLCICDYYPIPGERGIDRMVVVKKIELTVKLSCVLCACTCVYKHRLLLQLLTPSSNVHGRKGG